MHVKSVQKWSLGLGLSFGCLTAMAASADIVSKIDPRTAMTIFLPTGTTVDGAVTGRTRIAIKVHGKTIRNFTKISLPSANFEPLLDLYLHSLDPSYWDNGADPMHMDFQYRSGGDSSEVGLVWKETEQKAAATIIGTKLAAAYEKFQSVKDFLETIKTDRIGSQTASAGGKLECDGWYFSLSTCAPKMAVNIPNREDFGIPAAAKDFGFAKNHSSVPKMAPEMAEAMMSLVEDDLEKLFALKVLSISETKTIQNFILLVKIFYQGGFFYYDKLNPQGGAYKGGAFIPRTLAVTSLGLDPAPDFPGQKALVFGRPVRVPPRAVNFEDGSPVTISAISALVGHKRYGLSYTGSCILILPTNWESLPESNIIGYLADPAPYGAFWYTHSDVGEMRNEDPSTWPIYYPFGG